MEYKKILNKNISKRFVIIFLIFYFLLIAGIFYVINNWQYINFSFCKTTPQSAKNNLQPQIKNNQNIFNVKPSDKNYTERANTVPEVQVEKSDSSVSLPDTSKVAKHKKLNWDSVLWYDDPIEIDPINFYTQSITESAHLKCWIAGEIEGRRIVIAALNDGPLGTRIDRFEEKGESRFDVLEYYSDKSLLFDNKIVTGKNYQIIPSLEVPRVIYGPNGQVLTMDVWPGNNYSYDKKSGKIIYPENPYLFDKNLVRKVFDHSSYGSIYTSKNFDRYGILNRGGFYMPLPDGTFKSFYHSIPVTSIKWNKGNKTDGHYVSANDAGCGTGKYPKIIDDSIRDDLVVTGRMENRDVFEFKSEKESTLLDFYAEYEKSRNTLNGYGENYSDVSYDKFVKSHPIFFYEDDFGRLIEGENKDFVLTDGCGKPVVYLYPQNEIDADVKVEPSAGLTITIPNYGDGWKVHAYPNGKLINIVDGKEYPYLFWEGHSLKQIPEFDDGFIVARNELKSFFDVYLPQTGLVQNEINDFEEFWIPEMLKNSQPYFFIHFMFSDFMDEAAPLHVTPKPDTTIRVFMEWEPLNEQFNLKKQNLNAPARNGFTVVEWGGALHGKTFY